MVKTLILFLILVSNIFGNDITIRQTSIEAEDTKYNINVKLITEHHSEPIEDETYLQVNNKSKQYIVRIEGFGVIGFDIISDTKIVVIGSNHTVSATWLIDLNNLKSVLLGGGTISSFKNGEFILSMSKSYLYKNGSSLGAFWYNKKVDIEGNILEFLSVEDSESHCYKISELFPDLNNLPKLRQAPDTRICVLR